MSINIILFVTLLAYAAIVSQSIMYILCLKDVQMRLGSAGYAEIRKLIDANMNVTFRYVLYGSLIANLLLVIVTVSDPGGLLFRTALIAFIALLADTLMAVKGSIPINKMIDAWPIGNPPSNWQLFREKWFVIFRYRQVANLAGFVSLLIGAVFG